MSLGIIPAIGSLLGGASTPGPITGQERTNLGPLTATFTQPPECTTAIAVASGQSLLGRLGEVCGSEAGTVDTSCWPATGGGVAGPSTASPGWGFYSPGIVCPAGHTSACSATAGLFGKSDWPVQYSLTAGETAVGCCLSGYSCDNVGGQTCVQTTTSLAVPTTGCGIANNADEPAVFPRATVTAVTLFAPMFQMNWRSDDLSAFIPAPQTSSTSSQPIETGSSLFSATNTPSLSGTQTISADNSPTGNLETASSSASLVPAPLPTETAAQSGADSNATEEAGADQPEGSKGQGASFPVAAMVGVSVAGGLGALAVAIWAVYMWQRRRRYRKDMLQGISDDRMLQDLDNMYEATRPKTFDMAGRETMYDLRRQDTFGSRPDPDMSYGPGQETSRFFRAGPQRSPQVVGFSGITTAGGGKPEGLRDLSGDPGYGSYYRR
ncbi:hypothetical protein N8I77_008845 [Diaporthe amygdali]|uniref:Uncharacterized protein n=1 Tax=Phomopsis amygdali TaxID=1214568 RepID=A0AAD9W052_PHOAM|nr:hypothetical protein N8I77_008845 [Diaporthe amygdali]